MNDLPGDAQRPRRSFLAKAVGGVGALALHPGAAVAGANDRINVGIVGLGSRGGTLIGWIHRIAKEKNVRVAAICDLWEKRRSATSLRIRAETGHTPHACRTVGELLDLKEIDVVVIATPDFQHCYQAALATDAGKDVYCEKPFGCDPAEVAKAYRKIKASNQVFCFGVQSRGSDKYFAAADFVRSGKLGHVHYVEISEPICQQRWRIPGSEHSPARDEIDWQEFLTYLPASEHPFDARRFREFRLFWPFSTGPFCQWMSHRIDLVNLVLGCAPRSAMSMGGVYVWKDGRTNPDTVSCLLEYPGGTMCSYHMRMANSANGRGITFYGTTGTLDLEAGLAFGDGGGGIVRQQASGAFTVDSKRVLASRREGGVRLGSGTSVDYLAHFFDCVRTRQQPRGDLKSAIEQAHACLLADTAYRTGTKATFEIDQLV